MATEPPEKKPLFGRNGLTSLNASGPINPPSNPKDEPPPPKQGIKRTPTMPASIEAMLAKKPKPKPVETIADAGSPVASIETPSPVNGSAMESSAMAEDEGDNFGPPSRVISDDREVSPGTRADGTHAITSGDRGESYEPGKLNKLKGVFRH